jgi:hypothetical protein
MWEFLGRGADGCRLQKCAAIHGGMRCRLLDLRLAGASLNKLTVRPSAQECAAEAASADAEPPGSLEGRRARLLERETRLQRWAVMLGVEAARQRAVAAAFAETQAQVRPTISVRLSVCLSVHLPACLSVCLSTCLSVCLSVHPCLRPSTPSRSPCPAVCSNKTAGAGGRAVRGAGGLAGGP